MRQEMFRMDRVTYVQNGIVQLDEFDLQVYKGEIMGLISLNGLGQGSLLRLLQTNLPLYYGTVYYDEKIVNSYQSPKATFNRISIISERSCLVDDMSIAENIFVISNKFRMRLVRSNMLNVQVSRILTNLGIDMKADKPVNTLTHIQRCIVEIIKAVVSGSKLIVLKELSSFVSTAEINPLYDVLHYYTSQDISFLYLCNHPNEIVRICDRAAAMRDGHVMKIFHDLKTNQSSEKQIYRYFAKPFSASSQTRSDNPLPVNRALAPAVLEIDRLATGSIKSFSTTVRAGEYLVLQDLDKSFMDDFWDVMTGALAPDAGCVLLDGRQIAGPMKDRRAIAYLTENPAHSMVFQDLSYMDNLCFCADTLFPFFWLRPSLRKSLRLELRKTLGNVFDKPPNTLTEEERYSLVFARIRLQKPRLLLCINPFSSIDVSLRKHILKQMDGLLRQGVAIVSLVMNVTDGLTLADRMICIREGRKLHEHQYIRESS